MLLSSLRRAAAGAAAFTPFSVMISRPLAARCWTNGGKEKSNIGLFQEQQQAASIIEYALGHARSQRSAGSFAEAMLVLEQAMRNLGVAPEVKSDAGGIILLAMSTLHRESGELTDAMEKLKMVIEGEKSSIDVRVAAMEGLVGLNLEGGQDDTSSVITDECLQLFNSRQEDGTPISHTIALRCKAVRGLVDLVQGDFKTAELNFHGFGDLEHEQLPKCCANAILSYGEFLHASGNLSLANDFYKFALKISKDEGFDRTPFLSSKSSILSAANMVPEEASLGATCALGQVLAHSGNFQDAEEFLTEALVRAEQFFGKNDPKVGIVLTCMALMFGQKFKLEGASSLLIQEGLYRRAIDLLKAPPLDAEGVNVDICRRDLVALARGGYAETLCVQQNRKAEGERLKKWAETAWRNHRLSLAEALDFSEPSKAAAVIDTRISRVV